MRKLSILILAATASAAGAQTVDPPEKWEDVPPAPLNLPPPPPGVSWDKKKAPPPPPVPATPAAPSAAAPAAPTAAPAAPAKPAPIATAPAAPAKPAPVAAAPVPPAKPAAPAPVAKAAPAPAAPAAPAAKAAPAPAPVQAEAAPAKAAAAPPPVPAAPMHAAPARPAPQPMLRQAPPPPEHARLAGPHHLPRVERGHLVPPFWAGSQFHVRDHQLYGFPPPGPGMRWIRHYDDALLIDGEGRVHDVRYGLDWDSYGEPWSYERGIPEYVGDGEFYPEDEDYAWVESWDERGTAGAPHYGPMPPPYGYARPGGYGGYDHAMDREVHVEHGGGPYPPAPYAYHPPAAYSYGGYGHASYGYGYMWVPGVTITETTVTTRGGQAISRHKPHHEPHHRPAPVEEKRVYREYGEKG